MVESIFIKSSTHLLFFLYSKRRGNMNFDIKEVIIRIRKAYQEAHPFDLDINFLQELLNIENEFSAKNEEE